ncbi:TPA: hypothetical protein ACG4NT_000457 [Stenotrophomonas maltophilia]|uniref:hypothetical protein n=1 Tax=Stenotrophomonas TaxID=40323 RepID=UPI00018FF4B8|nr:MULTISPECIES: hypothetical protein [Stenotrophomonas]EED40625.1 hypothetical protein SSKA14_3648 [Stenotrophomonas sp. SKA14]MBN4939528.1 hypothetical protein [Stenotrophomonas maltophilia]PZT35851.1 hypothetical protein A7X97_13535 [Stenotrophomonas sepilia]
MRLSKLDIAIGHLEAACALYLAGHHPATVVLLAGTAEDMLRALPPANDTPTIGEHMLQVARQMSARQDLVYRDIKEDMVGLRNAVKHATREGEHHVDLFPVDEHRYLLGALLNAFRCGAHFSAAMTEAYVRIADAEG